MQRLLFLAFAVATLFPAPLTAQTRTVALGKSISWSPDDGPKRFSANGVEARIATPPCGARDQACREGERIATVTVSVGGVAKASLVGAASTQPAQLAFGPLSRGAMPSVMLTSWTGGAHCCTEIKVATPVGTNWKTVDLGDWDGDQIPFPKDISGDGIPDFVFVDNAFLYAFDCYACSYAPPQIFNIVAGRKTDVSQSAAFHRLFEKDFTRTRPKCLAHDNAACAAFAADAARLGRFATVWPIVLHSYDRSATEWPEPARYKNYPQALRAFLKANHYLP